MTSQRTQNLKIVMIIQARMGATRLPGKPLKKVMDRPLLSYLIERLKRVNNISTLIIATTTQPQDDLIETFCKKEKITVFRGSEEDVLDRYYQAAKKYQADVIIRITADCPLIDPKVIEQAIQFYLTHYPLYDYVSNTHKRTFPRGMDVELFSMQCLEEAAQEARLKNEREHVTPFIYNHPERYKIGEIQYSSNQANHRWTVDTPEDLALISLILQTLYPRHPQFTLQEILQELDNHPEWSLINARIQQKNLES